MIKSKYPNTVPPLPDYLADFTEYHDSMMPIISEIPGFHIDISKLQTHMKWVIDNFSPVYAQRDPVNHPTFKYGGWSVTSYTGEISNGWESHLGFGPDGKFDNILAYKNGWRPRWFHTRETEICTGYLQEIVRKVADMGFYPSAVRIMESPPGCYLGMHADAPPNQYSVRLHIPIITDQDAYHVWYTDPETYVHMELGKAYLIRTNFNHSAHNTGSDSRYHLVFDVWDTKGIVPPYKYDNIRHAEKIAKQYIVYCEKTLGINSND